MLGSLTLLLVYQLLGETLVLYFKLPVPGPVVGMLLLFLPLCVRGTLPDELRDTANGKLRALWLPLLVALLAGSITAIVSAVGIGWLLGASHNRHMRMSQGYLLFVPTVVPNGTIPLPTRWRQWP